ncbi:divalent-cation tolerance protein CutA [Streptomyces palmae]|uniref:Divalent-cation tolerance protein CutA n=1 Tax=Streptomyces palmae TaxID=1701085 RepID=A0A4Z0GCY8_9ACTN|nr:divalent-cation tolerance protein CutA [Streptomyces palmae]TGA93173.1 divalent-cation tolerance protein CutA [Streptomyces palmae]
MRTHEQAMVVTTTHESEDKARALAAEAVNARLAACAQVYPIASVYRWQGKVEQASEWRVDFKTDVSLADDLTTFVIDRHDYETPEVIAVPITAGSAAYLDWVRSQTGE